MNTPSTCGVPSYEAAGYGGGYLFIDDSKSANRRWCTMTACGNRAKAQRHYLKAKAARAAK